MALIDPESQKPSITNKYFEDHGNHIFIEERISSIVPGVYTEITVNKHERLAIREKGQSGLGARMDIYQDQVGHLETRLSPARINSLMLRTPFSLKAETVRGLVIRSTVPLNASWIFCDSTISPWNSPEPLSELGFPEIWWTVRRNCRKQQLSTCAEFGFVWEEFHFEFQ